MKRVLEPFLESFPQWRARPWLLALLVALAPGAYWMGRVLQAESARQNMVEMEGYAEIVKRARATAEALGIPGAARWKPSLRVMAMAEMNRFAQQNRDRIPEPVRRMIPGALVKVMLLGEGGKWVELRYSGEGQLMGYETSTGLFVSDAMLASTGTREVAQAALEVLFDRKDFEWAEPSMRTVDGGMAQRFDWSVRARCCPELTISASTQVVGRRAAGFWTSVGFQSDYLRRLNTPLNLLAGVMQLGFLLSALLFAGYRFAMRAMEREIPYGRAAVIWGVVLACGLAFAMLQPLGSAFGDEASVVASGSWYVGVVLGPLAFLVLGLVLALSYGATEGDIREAFPRRLISLDTLLSGRLLSQNTGTAIVAGAAWGAWVYCLTQIVRLWVAPGLIPLPGDEIRYSYSVAPWVGLLASNLVNAIVVAVPMVFLPLSMGRHLGNRPGRRRWITVLAALGAATIYGSPFSDSITGINAASWLVTLWVGLAGLDFLATIAALVVILGGSALVDLEALMPSWRQPAAVAFLVGGATLLVSLVASYLGRRYADSEVIPDYARNIEDKQSRRQEVSAAREAQLRLLPDHTPSIPGLGLSAFCTPSAQGVSGDFFDYYPMSRGRLGILVADGRAGGLGAALTIALAKGFVQYAAHRDWPAGETLRRLREIWHRDGDATGDLNLMYAVLDPAQRVIRFARLGPTPVILAGVDAGERATPLSGPSADGIMEGSGTFSHGDILLFYTDGVPHRLAGSHADGIDVWLRNKLRLSDGVSAYRIGEALQDALRSREGNAPDDLTAVVVRFEPAQSAALEASA